MHLTNSWTAPGEYLLRVESIALHVAESVGGAQFYISCGQIEVTGSGNATPSPTIDFPGGYSVGLVRGLRVWTDVRVGD